MEARAKVVASALRVAANDQSKTYEMEGPNTAAEHELFEDLLDEAIADYVRLRGGVK